MQEYCLQAQFRLIPTWRKSDVDPQQDTKANKSQPFRLLTLRDDPSPEFRQFADRKESKDDRADENSKIYRLLNKRISVEFKETAAAAKRHQIMTPAMAGLGLRPVRYQQPSIGSVVPDAVDPEAGGHCREHV